MKKRYLLILSLFLVILTMSYVNAIDNSTEVVKECDGDNILINQQEKNISISKVDESVGVISENKSSSDNVTNYCEVLGSTDDSEVLSISNSSSVLTSSVSVSNYKQPTKAQRTFNIAGFKATLTQSQYKKLYQISSIEDKFFDEGYNDYYYVGEKFWGYGISSTGLYYSLKVKTNKFIKVKVKIGNKYKIKKTRAYMIFTYGAGQSGIAYRHIVFLSHNYNNPGYDYAKELGSNSKYFTKCKHSTNFSKLNKSKLYNTNYVYKKYYIY